MFDRELGAQNKIPDNPPQHWACEKGTLNRRPKLLFLAWRFPPVRSIACVRTWNIARYLARLGWDVTVVTPHPSVWRHVESVAEVDARLKEEGIQRILTDHRWHCLLPDHLNCWNQGLGWVVGGICRKIARHFDIDSAIGWIKTAERACFPLTIKDVDIILASGPPFITFRLARHLSNRLGRPYVLDYRDPWTGNPYAMRPARPATVREEARLLMGGAAVTIVSPSWAAAINQRFDLGPKLQVVTNGYDAEELVDVGPYDFGHQAIVYAGNFYPPKRVISPIMAALKRLEGNMNGKSAEWYFHYYGRQGHHVRKEAEQAGVAERVVLHGEVPRAAALAALRGASVAVVITSVTEEATIEDEGHVPGKVFEILGLGIPTLLIAPPGSDIETIIETAGLVRRFTGSDIDGMASYLTGALGNHATKPGDCETYAWATIVKRIDSVLHEAMKTRSSSK